MMPQLKKFETYGCKSEKTLPVALTVEDEQAETEELETASSYPTSLRIETMADATADSGKKRAIKSKQPLPL